MGSGSEGLAASAQEPPAPRPLSKPPQTQIGRRALHPGVLRPKLLCTL